MSPAPSVGYWCPSGQTLATALPCPPGHFCLQGSASPEPCPAGTYQDRERQVACGVCEAGGNHLLNTSIHLLSLLTLLKFNFRSAKQINSANVLFIKVKGLFTCVCSTFYTPICNLMKELCYKHSCMCSLYTFH